jgi:hypothetical protein
MLLAGAEVDNGVCTPSVLEVVLEVSPYYLGNPNHCPEDFPKFPLLVLLDCDKAPGNHHFADGAIDMASTSNAILNILQGPLLKVFCKSNIPSLGHAQEKEQIYDSTTSVQTELLTKLYLYLYYEDTWWYYKLGL